MDSYWVDAVRRRADCGIQAIQVGDPDYGEGADRRTSAVDTIANVLHAVAKDEDDARNIIESAFGHYEAEIFELQLEREGS